MYIYIYTLKGVCTKIYTIFPFNVATKIWEISIFGETQVQKAHPFASLRSSSLGNGTPVSSVEVTWPTGGLEGDRNVHFVAIELGLHGSTVRFWLFHGAFSLLGLLQIMGDLTDRGKSLVFWGSPTGRNLLEALGATPEPFGNRESRESRREKKQKGGIK